MRDVVLEPKQILRHHPDAFVTLRVIAGLEGGKEMSYKLFLEKPENIAL